MDGPDSQQLTDETVAHGETIDISVDLVAPSTTAPTSTSAPTSTPEPTSTPLPTETPLPATETPVPATETPSGS